MRNLPEAMHGLFRKARREQKLTQSELAHRVGCRQSAISMFESGRDDALSRDTLAALAKVLHIELLPAATSEAPTLLLKYCPIADCPSNIPYVVGDQVCFKPSLVQESAAVRGHCTYCGELLESACPNPDCRAPIQEGAFCSSCGEHYVTATVSVTLPAEDWVCDRREQIRDLHSLSSTTSRHPLPAPSVLRLDEASVAKAAKPKRRSR